MQGGVLGGSCPGYAQIVEKQKKHMEHHNFGSLAAPILAPNLPESAPQISIKNKYIYIYIYIYIHVYAPEGSSDV